MWRTSRRAGAALSARVPVAVRTSRPIRPAMAWSFPSLWPSAFHLRRKTRGATRGGRFSWRLKRKDAEDDKSFRVVTRVRAPWWRSYRDGERVTLHEIPFAPERDEMFIPVARSRLFVRNARFSRNALPEIHAVSVPRLAGSWLLCFRRGSLRPSLELT